MGYSEDDFRVDIIEALKNASSALSIAGVGTDTMSSHLVSYYVGDKPLKRELQVLLDKFEDLFQQRRMYDKLDYTPTSDKEYEYTQQAMHLASMIDKKLENVIVFSEKKTYIFAEKASHDRTRALIEDVQLIIDLM